MMIKSLVDKYNRNKVFLVLNLVYCKLVGFINVRIIYLFIIIFWDLSYKKKNL